MSKKEQLKIAKEVLEKKENELQELRKSFLEILGWFIHGLTDDIRCDCGDVHHDLEIALKELKNFEENHWELQGYFKSKKAQVERMFKGK
jgi:hypothetical protein